MNTSTRIFAVTVLFILFFTTKLFCITIVSNGTGNWALPATWNPLTTPACGDSIVIQSVHTVSVINQQNYGSCTPMKIVIYGKLKFLFGSKLTLPCGSYVIVKPGGRIEADIGFAASNYIEICSNIEWNSNSALDGPACLPPTHPICAYALPVELSRFSSSSCDKKICLEWQTESEKNCEYFELQRSADGIHFSKINEQPSKSVSGYSYSRLYYECSDNTPAPGINYYRLKQMDRDGSYSYSKILSVQSDHKAGTDVIVYPSVTDREFSALIKDASVGQAVILLRNSKGEIVHKEWKYVNDASEAIRVSPRTHLDNGIYYCSFIFGNDEYNAKVLISGTR